jgi:ABC-type lipoprotein release transport system permease subunit
MRRKVRMSLIGFLVFIGTIIIVFGETFSLSAKYFSRQAIIEYFTGDVILYSTRSKELPSPFSFTTPLPLISEPQKIIAWLKENSFVKSHVALSQNYGLLSIDKLGKKSDVPFIFYAANPSEYRSVFQNIKMVKGAFFDAEGKGLQKGVVLSDFQVKNYSKNYSVDLEPGDKVTLLSLTEGASVNAVPSEIIGIYEPLRYKNVFNYINFMDMESYSRLYNFTGVDAASLPADFTRALKTNSDDEIFNLAGGKRFDSIDTKKLVARDLTGFTMIAIKLKNHNDIPAFTATIKKANLDVAVAPWNKASGFFSQVAAVIQSVIYGATFLIFLIVVFILMNTLIIGALERTGEIGTLRAMGGEKSFITAIFLWESFLLNGSALVLGMFVSAIMVITVSLSGGIALPDVMAQYLIGGGKLELIVSVRPFLEAIGIVLFVSTVATIYPVRVATSITPLKAMTDR